MVFSKVRPKAFLGVSVALCTVTGASLYLRKKIEDKIYGMDLCRTSIETFMSHKKSLDLVGSPAMCGRPKLSNVFNKVTDTDATISIPVSGSKLKGNLLIVASKKQSASDWTLKSLNLETTDSKIAIYEMK